MEHTKGEVIVEAFPGTDKDPTWIIQVKGNGIIFQTVGANDEANAKEFFRRWNAFEDGGIVEELRTACVESQKAIMLLYECNKEVEIALGSGIQLKKAEGLLEAALAKS